MDIRSLLKNTNQKNYTQKIIGLVTSTLFINILTLILPITLLQIYDRIIPYENLSTLYVLTLLASCAFILEAFLTYGRMLIIQHADAEFEYKLSINALHRLLACKLSEFEKISIGNHYENLSAIQTMSSPFYGKIFVAILDLIFAGIFIAFIAYIASWLALIPLTLVVCYPLIVLLQNKRLYSRVKHTNSAKASCRDYLITMLTNIHVVKSYGLEQQIQANFNQLQLNMAKKEQSYNFQYNFQQDISITVCQFTTLAVASAGAILAINGSITLGALAACSLLASKTINPVMKLYQLYIQIVQYNLNKQSLKSIYSLSTENYNDNSEDKLDNINFTNIAFNNIFISQQNSYAIHYPNNASKQILIENILGLNKNKNVEILLNDKPIDFYNIRNVRRQIAYLGKNSTLIRGTIFENIVLFQPNIYKEKALNLIKDLGLNNIIDQLPHGIHTPVGELVNDILSKGMIDWIAIARSLINNPKFIIFDEATCCLSNQAKKYILEYLANKKTQYTLLLFSNSPDVLELADHHYQLKAI